MPYEPEEPQVCVECGDALGMDTVSIARVGYCCSADCADMAIERARTPRRRDVA